MVRFLLRTYPRFFVAVVAAASAVQIGAIAIYDLGILDWRSETLDILLSVYAVGLFTIVPCVVAYHASAHHDHAAPRNRSLRGWSIGLSSNAIVGAASVVFGLFQAGLRHYVLQESESQTGNYLLLLLLGFVFVLWLGGVTGWIGHRAAIHFGRETG
jgi:hypothetical protein